MRSLGRALVVGGAGFAGGWLVECLVSEGMGSTVLDLSAGSKEAFGVEVIADDVSRVDVKGVVGERDIDAVFYLAGTPSAPRREGDPGAPRTLGAAVETSLLDGPQQAAEWLLVSTHVRALLQQGAP